MTAAALIAAAAAAQLEARLAWLDASGGGDDPAAERAWHAARGEAPGEARLAGPEGEAWTRLVGLFGLSAAEAALLRLALAVAIEPALGPLVARAQGQPGRLLPTEALAVRLAALTPMPILRPTSPLALWGLARAVAGAPGEPAMVEADPRLVDWLAGVASLDAALVAAVAAPTADEALPPEWPLAATAERLARVLAAGREARLVIEARAGAGRRRFAAAVARALGRQPLLVDPVVLAASDWADGFMRVQRFALCFGGAPVWREGGPAWPARPPLAPLQLVCVDEGGSAPSRYGAVDLRVTLPEPSIATRTALWRRLAPAQDAAAAHRIAALPGLSLADLEQVALRAPADAEAATAELRALMRARLAGIGRAIDPRFGWDDLVLPPATVAALRRFAFEAAARATVLAGEAGRVFAGSAGLAALFAGPPGVGKSTAAQVVARELGVNLLVVDLAATTSKYVGETAKNLSQAFARARAAGALLLFEEADALFARRTEVKDGNDRHANADTGHLLQLMEEHGETPVILSTNRRANIDPAFVRRLRHAIEFPRPGLAERATIWAAALAALGADGDVAPGLAQRFDLSPAQIKGAALTARYAALADDRAIGLADLEAAVAIELTKEGRAMPAAELRAVPRPRATLRG